MITLIKEIAIRPLDAGEAFSSVKLTNIMEGVDGAATFGYSLEAVALQVEDNQKQQYKHIHTFDVRVIEESADSAIIDGWIATQTRVEIVGRGIDGFFVMSDVLLTRNEQYDQVVASAYLATSETLTAYSTGQLAMVPSPAPTVSAINGARLPVFAGSDLLERFNKDVANSNYSSGGNNWPNYIKVNGDILSNTSGDVVTLTSNSDTSEIVSSETFYAPYTNQIYKGTLNVVNFSNGSTAPTDLRFGIAFFGSNTVSNLTHVRQEIIDANGLYEVYASTETTTNNQTETRDVGVSFKFPAEKTTNVQFDIIKLEVYPSSTLPAGLASYTTEEIT